MKRLTRFAVAFLLVAGTFTACTDSPTDSLSPAMASAQPSKVKVVKVAAGPSVTITAPASAPCNSTFSVSWKSTGMKSCQVSSCVGALCGSPQPGSCQVIAANAKPRGTAKVYAYGSYFWQMSVTVGCTTASGDIYYACSVVSITDSGNCKG